MTLITRLSTSFNVATLPLLKRDPVVADAGARLLLDFKNPGTWPSQAATINLTDPVYSLHDGSWPDLFPAVNPMRFDTAAGGIGNFDTDNDGEPDSEDRSLFYLTDDYTTNPVINNASHSYVFSLWMKKAPRSSGGYGYGQTYVNFTGLKVHETTPGSRYTWTSSEGTGNQASIAISDTTVTRVGFSGYNDGGTWKVSTIVNDGTPSVSNMSGTGISVDAINPSLFMYGSGVNYPNPAHRIYRLYVEDLTVSGRTAEQVWDADWARANGRFS